MMKIILKIWKGGLKMSKSTLDMTRTEWLMDRKKGIGGSDVATILGLNKWKAPYQLWLEKTGQIEIEESDSVLQLRHDQYLHEEMDVKDVRKLDSVFELFFQFVR
jgi:predicted phage-related endonuclease